jgi:hypothetical protein
LPGQVHRQGGRDKRLGKSGKMLALRPATDQMREQREHAAAAFLLNSMACRCRSKTFEICKHGSAATPPAV